MEQSVKMKSACRLRGEFHDYISRFTLRSGWPVAVLLALVPSRDVDRRDRVRPVRSPTTGKNRVKYDKFDWHIYTTDHFDIYYYPELEEHLERSGQLCGERLPASKRRPPARSGVQCSAHRLQDAQRIRTAEPDPRRHTRGGGGVRRAAAQSHRPSDRRAARRAVPPDYSRTDPHLRIRHHSALHHSQHGAALGRRRTLRLHGRRLASDRPDDGA